MEAAHIRPLISLLKVIDNPAQDIYLAAAMLGPMFGFTDDDLVRLRAQSAAMQKKAQEEQGAKETGKRASRMSLYGAVLQVVQNGDETPFTRKVKDFYDRLTARPAVPRQNSCWKRSLSLPAILLRWAYWKTVRTAGKMPGALRLSAHRPVQTASRRWCVPSTRRRRPVLPGRTLCPAVRGLAV